jgi:hypothetical protein
MPRLSSRARSSYFNMKNHKTHSQITRSQYWRRLLRDTFHNATTTRLISPQTHHFSFLLTHIHSMGKCCDGVKIRSRYFNEFTCLQPPWIRISGSGMSSACLSVCLYVCTYVRKYECVCIFVCTPSKCLSGWADFTMCRYLGVYQSNILAPTMAHLKQNSDLLKNCYNDFYFI